MSLQTIVDIVRVAGSLFIVVGGSIAIATLRHNAKTNRSKFIRDLTESFILDDEARRFWYRLDYDDWKFDLKNFRQSDEERCVDALLYKFSITGQLLRNGSVAHSDLVNVYPLVRQFFSNIEVRNYLRFNMIDFWRVAGHTGFHWPDAMHLYFELTKYHAKKNLSNREELEDCKRFMSELRRIPFEKDLRTSIAIGIEYDRDLD